MHRIVTGMGPNVSGRSSVKQGERIKIILNHEGHKEEVKFLRVLCVHCGSVFDCRWMISL
jgi:hypothetical protein